MAMLLGCAQGLLLMAQGWQKADCPLQRVDFVAQENGRIAAADASAGLLYHGGRTLSCSRSTEALALWQGHALLLSSDTDCLTLYSPGGDALITARVGVYPQDMFLQENTVCVCGGADGYVHLLSLPEMVVQRSWPVPGMPQRIAAAGTSLHILCLAEDAGVHCTLVHLDARTGRCVTAGSWPGLPGAIAAEADGTLWLAASEQLLCIPPGASAPQTVYEGFGLIRHIDVQRGSALVTDPLEELCAVCSRSGAVVVYRGDAGQALFRR